MLLFRIERKNRSVGKKQIAQYECMTNNLQLATVKTISQDVQRINTERAWQQLCERDRSAGFFYAVTTTGVFCRPECKSRRPLRENVRFFGTSIDAQNAGFRACKRCKPADTAWGRPLDLVRRHLESNLDRSVPLAELGKVAGMSRFTVQRAFKQEMGVSPLQYQRSLRAARLRDALKQQNRVTDAIYDAGFGSSSRAYEGVQLGMTPARFAQGGKGEQIRWCAARSPFGWVVVGSTDRGLCWLSLGSTREEAEASLCAEFPAAELSQDSSLSDVVELALANVREGSDLTKQGALGGGLDLRGTVFQLRVWQALRQIPRGETRSYSELAREMGEPNSTRAVARACATNRVALIVPCHRVVGADGSLTGYRWGVERKRELLEAEKG
jgi:AraC family transcriptional regulator, regulatory protein of adaptative response / methylated-DNA-[protein]-cysteine methyltransferase